MQPEQAAAKPNEIRALTSLPFILLHLSTLFVWLVPFRWEWVFLCAATYAVRMFGITAGYHRYFSHRSYKSNRLTQFALAFLGTSALQKGVLWWAANHRHHHRYSDQPKDLHSPIQHGFFWSHVGWILSHENDATRWDLIPDLAQFPELRWLNRFYFIPPAILAGVLFIAGGWGALLWGFCISTVLLWHGTFTINSLAHVFGSVRYRTTDTSRNNVWLALITLGEGWHNNHHCYMVSANQGFFWWEIDITFYILKMLSWVGVVSHLKKPPLQLLKAKLLKPSLRIQTPNSRDEEKVPYLEHA